MSAVSNTSILENEKKNGVAHWMDRVLKEHARFETELSSDLAHDLRVALRRCRVIAGIMKDLDPGSEWQEMRKTARRLFRPMGDLRDVQVQIEGAERIAADLHLSADPFLNELKARYEQERVAVQLAVRRFNRKQWEEWTRKLSSRFRRLAGDSNACKAITLAQWNRVHSAYQRLRKHRSHVAHHRLRIEIKKFRYAVENCLPSLYPAWDADLKSLQDVLGEIHDRDVLASTLARAKRFFEPSTHARWLQELKEEREPLVRKFHQQMNPKDPPMWVWREALPSGKELKPVGLAQLALWAEFVAPDARGSQQVAKFALQLYDGAVNSGQLVKDPGFDARFVLKAAALLQEVGRFKKGKARHKVAYRMIRRAAVPVGWTRKELALVACVARFRRGALPRVNHKALRDYPAATRQSLIAFAALLRLANAFRAKPYRSVRHLRLERDAGMLVVRAEGYAGDRVAPKLHVAKYLIEFAFQRPLRIVASNAGLGRPHLVRSAARIDAA